MEAKENICTGCGRKLDSPAAYHPIECCISFKAGEQLGITKGISLRVKDMSLLSETEMNELNTIAENYLEAVRQEGRREVAEWISCYEYNKYSIFVNHNEWQAQLKWWGL